MDLYLGSGGGRAFGNRVPRGATSDKNHILQTCMVKKCLFTNMCTPLATGNNCILTHFSV
jgi:hypothetical protein